MKKRGIIFACALLGMMFANAQLKQKFETKVTATPVLASCATNDLMVYAGKKKINVIQLSDGKKVLDKEYKDMGVSVDNAVDACLSKNGNQLVVCNKKNVISCIDYTTGKKLWETQSFTELDNGGEALTMCGNWVIVSDKKGKDNYTLSAVDVNSGKVLWTIENEKEKIETDRIYDLSDSKMVGVFTKGKKDNNLFRILNIENGKVEVTTEITGSPIFTLFAKDYLFIHHHVSEDNSFVSAFNLKDKKLQWTVKSTNKSPQTPIRMNTDKLHYYATIQQFDDKVMLKTAGLEVFDLATGKSLYNIPYVPYYKWGVGQYTDAIFEPQVTDQGILIADGTQGDLSIKLFDKQNGKQLWSTDKLKNKNAAPRVIRSGNTVAVQFGGVSYFEVLNNAGIGKLLDPFMVTAYDLQSGKMLWNVESKKDFYRIEPTDNSHLMIVGTKELQTVDLNNGSIVKTEKNPFKESYFMTKGGYANLKLQKDVAIDFGNRVSVLFEDEKLSVSTF